jgi:membrane protease YdiL (CAAX protease family)
MGALVRAILRVIAAFLLGGVGLFAGVLLLNVAYLFWPEPGEAATWVKPLASHTGMLLAGFVLAAALSKGRIRNYGFRWPTSFPIGWIVLVSCGVSGVFNGTAALARFEGLSFLEDYSLVQTILLVWIYASVAEEVLARGFVQSFLAPLARHALVVGRLRLSAPVVLATVFFAGSHLLLLTTGIGPATVLLVVGFTFCGGLVTGYFRERTDSLVPAIVAHALFNLTGSLVGLLSG